MTSSRGKPPARNRRGARAARGRRLLQGSDVVTQLQRVEDTGGDGTIRFGDRSLAVSKLGKVFFPRIGVTKGDLMRYYARVASVLLPAIADRPLVLKRFPDGIDGESFYQQRAPADPPELVRVEPVADEGITTQRRLIGGDLPTLLYIVQLGAISVDPWHSRVGSIDDADYSIIDLDPGPRATFDRVVQVARWVREELELLGLHAVPKTSGASGIHIVLPLEPETPNESARLVAELIATRVAERHPREATVHRWVQSRPVSSVYMDYLQNIRGKTVAGVYSVRAEPLATVSTPLRWEELTDDLDPRGLTMDVVLQRLRDHGDLWAAGMKRRNSLRRLLGA